MPSRSIHVLPNSRRGGWDVKRGEGVRASSHHDTKQEAIDRAREISRRERRELIIHNQDGRISNRDSHGNDPFPPPG